MKLELTDSDKKKFEAEATFNPVIRYLKNQDNLRFNIGDILIRETLTSKFNPHSGSWDSAAWCISTVSSVSNAPKKFMYVYENEYGVGYIKQLKASGDGFTDYYACLANTDPTNTRYKVDPDYADHMLINGNSDDYKPSEAFEEDKKRRLEIKEYNKSLLRKVGNHKEVNDLMDSLKVGDQLWWGWDIYSAANKPYTVKTTAKKVEYSKQGWTSEGSDGTDSHYRIMTVADNSGCVFTLTTKELINKKLMTSPPRKFRE
jgi:hypothetical protein